MNYETAKMRWRVVVRLRVEGWSQAKIADLFGISKQRVSQMIQDGMPKEENYQKHPSELTLIQKNGHNGREYTRMFVRYRDNFTCQDCGVQRTPQFVENYNKRIKGLKGRIKNLDVHHIDGRCGENSRGFDPMKDAEKMTTLCHRCHFNRPEHKTNNKNTL